MTYDAGHPCCAEYGVMKLRIEQLEAALKELAEAVEVKAVGRVTFYSPRMKEAMRAARNVLRGDTVGSNASEQSSVTVKPYTDAELKRFDRLTQKLTSRNPPTRIEAGATLIKLIAKHGREKCAAMFAVLKQRDERP